MNKCNKSNKSTIRNPQSAIKHPLLFVGAGPGDPELITVKGKKALEEADLVIYAGSLVPEAILKWTRPETQTINSASMHLEEIIAEIQAACAAGKRVVRLHRWLRCKSDQFITGLFPA
jgi:precorrin-4/cobalt-precorrin-4 C11-methyltransferase